MKFPKLVIENFLAITKAEIDLADRGLVAIQGKNSADSSANSNGAGKSTIADGLCWCWYGTTARGATGDDVINDTVGKNCRVSSTIIDGAVTYTATRHRKHKTGKNRFTLTMHDGLTETDLTKGTDKLTQIEANKIIGSSLEVFAGSIYAGQEKMPDLPAYTDKQLKMLVEEAAGVTLLEDAYKKAREAFITNESDLLHTMSTQATLINRKTDLEDQVNTISFSISDWEKNQKLKSDGLAEQARGIVTKVKTVTLEINALNSMGFDKALIEIDQKISGVAAENVKLHELEQKIAVAQGHVTATRNSLRAENQAVENVKTQLANVSSKIGTPCGECGRPITEAELAASKASIQSKIDQHEQWAADYTKDLADANQSLLAATNERDRFKAGMTDISAEQIERQRLAQEKKKLDDKISDRQTLLGQAELVKKQITALKGEQNPHEAVLTKTKGILEKTITELDTINKRVAATQGSVDVDKEVVRVFSPAGVRARILDEVTPFLNAQTSKYLSTLSDGNISATWTTLVPAAKKGEFKEKFSIEVANTTGGQSFKTLSGGEKRKVRIATALALQDLVATRASKPIDLFIGDEIDDALDASGLERLMLILDEKAKERGSVFVISHNELSDHIRQTLTIEKTAGGETKITEMAA